MRIVIEPIAMDHYEEVIALWKKSEHVSVTSADEREKIKGYLARNPGMSFVAKEDGTVVGAALCGHDGRRGYLHHLAVAPSHRKRGIGRALVVRCIESLKTAGIEKCHLFVFKSNREGRAFWRRIGWRTRTDLQVLSKET